MRASEIPTPGKPNLDVPEPPKLFDDSLLQDMSSVLLTLEKRVKEGPGSLTSAEVDDLSDQLERIKHDMRVNQDKKPPRPARVDSEETQSATETTAASASSAPTADASSSPSSTAAVTTSGRDDNEDEGPVWDGRGGMGQPKGTVNTYVIPGMEEMDTEEYRNALEKSLIDRQRARRASGARGNQSATDYLNSLK
jgi:hypothetical protein